MLRAATAERKIDIPNQACTDPQMEIIPHLGCRRNNTTQSPPPRRRRAESVCAWPERRCWMEAHRCCHPRLPHSGRPRGTAFSQQRGASVLPRSTKTICLSWTRRWDKPNSSVVEHNNTAEKSADPLACCPMMKSVCVKEKRVVDLVGYIQYAVDGLSSKQLSISLSRMTAVRDWSLICTDTIDW